MFTGNQAENETEAYLLGFIYADGCIVANGKYKAYRTMNIALSRRDEEFLLNLNLMLDGNIKYYEKDLNDKKYPQVRLSKYSKEFVDNIRRLGIEPNKTYSDSTFIFDNIPYEYKWDFIRGMFDGDGSISLIKSNNNYCVSLCCHNIFILIKIHKFINSFLNTQSNVTKGDGVHRIRYGGNNNVLKIFRNMYNSNSICLKRKYNIFLNIDNNKKLRMYDYILKDNAKRPYCIRIKDKRLGRFDTLKDALIYFNAICDKYGLQEQNYIGDELYE